MERGGAPDQSQRVAGARLLPRSRGSPGGPAGGDKGMPFWALQSPARARPCRRRPGARARATGTAAGRLRGVRLILLAWVLSLLAGPAPGDAGDGPHRQVLFVGDPQRPPHQQLAGAAIRTLQAHAPDVQSSWRGVDGLAEGEAPGAEGDLLVTIGVEAALAAVARTPEVPTVVALVPATTYAHIRAQRSARGHAAPVTALLLDQPIARRLRLVEAAFPATRRLTVLLGPASAALEAPLREAVAGRWELAVETVEDTDAVLPALRRLLRPGGVLLSFADPTVYNRQTVKSVLLTSYRHQVPVVGFSRSYVKAGAVVAVYSTPEQLGVQLGHLLARALTGAAGVLPGEVAPDTWTVAVNHRVARSLGLELPAEDELRGRLASTLSAEAAP